MGDNILQKAAPYRVIACDMSGNWYAYGEFDSRREACHWAERNLPGYDWHVAQNVCPISI